MDRGPEKNLNPGARERWYLRVQGRTLGPLDADEVKFGLETEEFLPSDKIASSGTPAWLLVSDHPLFRQFGTKEEGLRSQMLVPPPPPQLLRVKPQPSASAQMPAVIPAPPKVVVAPEPVVEAPPTPRPPAIPEKFLRASPIPHVLPTKIRDLPDAAPAERTKPSLNEATQELERFLKTLKKSATAPVEQIAPPAGKPALLKPKVEVSAPIPTRPSYEPVFFGVPEPKAEKTKEKKKREARSIQIELKLPERPWRMLIVVAGIVLALFLAFGNRNFDSNGENKTRDLKDSRLPDPSSPTNQPSEAGDPVPPLKAPTRPQRD